MVFEAVNLALVREKSRYLLFRLESPQPISVKDARYLLYSAAIEFLGEAGAARSRLRLVEFDDASQRGIAKCALSGLEESIAALALKRFWQGRDVAIRVEKISGVIGRLATTS
ncbi:MAG: Rpp14/Pop5 family protein [Candidatus Norongarragalinales archaeon]